MVKISKTSSAFQFCYFSKNTKLLLSDEKLLRLGWRYFASESRGMMKDTGAI